MAKSAGHALACTWSLVHRLVSSEEKDREPMQHTICHAWFVILYTVPTVTDLANTSKVIKQGHAI